VLLVPTAASRATSPAARPLVVLLHGAGGRAGNALPILGRQAEREGALLLVPDARASTWDVLRDGYGPDVRFLDRALERVFARHAVDPARIALAGFSDGASYALSLGLGNGDLFTHLIAFAPGFAAPEVQVGRPRIFVTHGLRDEVLPIAQCSHRLVPLLGRSGYDVTYREFPDGHVVPVDLADAAMRWFLSDGGDGGDGPAADGRH
jgi:phospholipase/carboxylesterase